MSNVRYQLGVHALVLVDVWDRPTSSRVITYSIDTNPVVVRRVMSDLETAGLVESKRGPGGGFTLARDADEITLLDVYRAVDTGPVFKPYREHTVDDCPVGGRVSDVLDAELDAAVEALHAALDGTTVADVVEAVRADAEPDIDASLLDSLWKWRTRHERELGSRG